MKLRHPNHYAIAKTIASALLMAAAGCATPDTDRPQAWRIEAVFNVKHAIQSSQGYYTLGRYHDGSKAWGLAVDAYRKAIAIDAHNLEAYNALGVALAQSGRHADAETVLRQAVALAPELSHVRSNLGYVLMLAGKPDEAVLALKAAVLQDRFTTPRQWLICAMRSPGGMPPETAAQRRTRPPSRSLRRLRLQSRSPWRPPFQILPRR